MEEVPKYFLQAKSYSFKSNERNTCYIVTHLIELWTICRKDKFAFLQFPPNQVLAVVFVSVSDKRPLSINQKRDGGQLRGNQKQGLQTHR
jgi:hypothetical protein